MSNSIALCTSLAKCPHGDGPTWPTACSSTAMSTSSGSTTSKPSLGPPTMKAAPFHPGRSEMQPLVPMSRKWTPRSATRSCRCWESSQKELPQSATTSPASSDGRTCSRFWSTGLPCGTHIRITMRGGRQRSLGLPNRRTRRLVCPLAREGRARPRCWLCPGAPGTGCAADPMRSAQAYGPAPAVTVPATAASWPETRRSDTARSLRARGCRDAAPLSHAGPFRGPEGHPGRSRRLASHPSDRA